MNAYTDAYDAMSHVFAVYHICFIHDKQMQIFAQIPSNACHFTNTFITGYQGSRYQNSLMTFPKKLLITNK
jgi:hypothetical protein